MDSYAQGETTPALLEETIGANLERTVAAHGDREALVECARTMLAARALDAETGDADGPADFPDDEEDEETTAER